MNNSMVKIILIASIFVSSCSSQKKVFGELKFKKYQNEKLATGWVPSDKIYAFENIFVFHKNSILRYPTTLVCNFCIVNEFKPDKFVIGCTIDKNSINKVSSFKNLNKAGDNPDEFVICSDSSGTFFYSAKKLKEVKNDSN